MARQCRRQEKTEGRPTDKGQRTITWARVILSPTRLCNIMDVTRSAKSLSKDHSVTRVSSSITSRNLQECPSLESSSVSLLEK